MDGDILQRNRGRVKAKRQSSMLRKTNEAERERQ